MPHKAQAAGLWPNPNPVEAGTRSHSLLIHSTARKQCILKSSPTFQAERMDETAGFLYKTQFRLSLIVLSFLRAHISVSGLETRPFSPSVTASSLHHVDEEVKVKRLNSAFCFFYLQLSFCNLVQRFFTRFPNQFANKILNVLDHFQSNAPLIPGVGSFSVEWH
jgi:hypothetical protein